MSAAAYVPQVGDRVRVRRWVQTTAGERSDETVRTGKVTDAYPHADDWYLQLDERLEWVFTGYQFLGAGQDGRGPASLMTEVTPLDDTDGQDAYRQQVTPELAVALDGSQCVVLDVTHPHSGIRLHQVTISDVAALKAALDGALAARQAVEEAGRARRYAGPDEAREARGCLVRAEAVEWLIAKSLSRAGAVRATRQLRDGFTGDAPETFGMTYSDGYWRVPVTAAGDA